MTKAKEKTRRSKKSAPPQYRLRLFVTGATRKAREAIANIRTITDQHLEGRYELQVIDALQQSEMLRGQQIVVLPTLVKELPPPMKRLIGDLGDEERVLIALGLHPEIEGK